MTTNSIDFKSEGNYIIKGNELRFDCVFSALYTSKLMFDNFGKWTTAVKIENRKYPFLKWENVNLDLDNENCTIYAYGKEADGEIYTSVLIYDQDGNDLLGSASSQRESLIQYFSNKIRSLNDDEKFYEQFWKTVDKSRWRELYGK